MDFVNSSRASRPLVLPELLQSDVDRNSPRCWIRNCDGYSTQVLEGPLFDLVFRVLYIICS